MAIPSFGRILTTVLGRTPHHYEVKHVSCGKAHTVILADI